MSKRDFRLLLDDIIESIEKIENYTREMSFEEFLHDSKTVDAVVRNLEIIGEAASQLPQSFKKHQDQIEWRQIAGLRNRVIHGYFGVDLNIIWKIISEELAELDEKIRVILGS